MGEWPTPALPVDWTTSGQAPFIARHDEVAVLETAWADASRGAGRAVFVSGEPGSGKSRLVSEVCTRLREAGAAVLVGSSIQELGAPFEPFDEPLRMLLPALGADAGDARSTGAGGSTRTGTAGSTDAVDLLERVLARTGADAADESMGQERVFAAVVEVLRAAAATRPVVLALDDLHWAGPAAVRLLGRVVEGTADARVLVLGTLRSSAPDRSEVLAETLASLDRLSRVQRVDLDPFDADEITEYVAVRADISPAAAREPAAVLAELTGGNPFLLRAMWRPVIEAELRGDHRVIELPDTVSDLVRTRVATLAPVQRSVLELAAVLGQEVELTEVLGVSTTSVDDTLTAMDAAVRAGLIEPPHAAGDRYRFPHAIARQAVIDLMPGTQALRAHARIAEVLEAEFPAAPRLVQRLAHHYAAARALGYGDRAVTYLGRAAQLAERRFAYEDAGRLYERAAEISPDTEERAELLLHAAANWNVAADTSRARDLCERVVETAGPRLQLRAAIAYEEASWRPGRPGHRALDLLTAALQSVPPDDDDPLYLEALAALARATAFTGAVDEAEQIGERAIGLARAHGDPRLLASTLRAAQSLTLRPRGVAERLAVGDELLALVRPTGSEWVGAAALHRAANCYLVGDRVGIDESERDLMETRRRWGRHWTYWIESVRFVRALIGGRLEDAETASRLVQQGEGVFRSDATSAASALQGYMVRRERGQLERVRHFITGDEAPTDRWAPGLLALCTELGLRDPAHRTLDWLLAHSGAESRDSGDWPAHLAFMAEAAIWLGDTDAAERVHPLLEEYSGLNLMSGVFVAPFGPADTLLGELESLCGTGDPMERFESALVLAERIDAPLHTARALAAMAAHVARTDPASPEAAAFAARARAIAEPAGMVRVLRALDAGIGIGDAASVGEPVGGLTAREREVIGLIAQGHSNRDIAEHLVISEHTAANHVRNILAKLGAVNRTQAAMFAREHGLA